MLQEMLCIVICSFCYFDRGRPRELLKKGAGIGFSHMLSRADACEGNEIRRFQILKVLRFTEIFGGSQKGGIQKGGFGGCSPGTKTGTRVRSPKPPFYETALLSPNDPFWC